MTSIFNNLSRLYIFLPTGEIGGNIQIIAEEIEDTKFEVKLQLSAVKLDKKDFFGKVNYFN